MSAASAGVASATAATAVKRNFFIGCPFQYNATPAVCCCSSDRDFVFPVVASPRLCTKRNNPRRPEKANDATIAVFLGESALFRSKESKCCDSNTTAGRRLRTKFSESRLPAHLSEPKSGNPTSSRDGDGRYEWRGLPQAAAAFLRLASSRASTSATVASMTALRRPFCAAIACTSLSARSIFGTPLLSARAADDGRVSDCAAAAYFSNGTRSSRLAPSLTQRSTTKL